MLPAYKPTRRLSLGRSQHFVWAPRTRHHVVVWMFRNRYWQFEFTSLHHPVRQFLVVLRKNIRFGREPRIVLRNLEETASTAEGFLHHAHRAELVTDPG